MKKIILLIFFFLPISYFAFGQIPAAPTISASKTVICGNETVDLTAVGCTGEIRWNFGANGINVYTMNFFNQNYTYDAYAYCVNTSTNQSSENSNTVSITIKENPAVPSLSKNPSSPVNPNTNVTLTQDYGCSPTYVLDWSNGASGQSIVVSPAITTTYTASCSNDGCLSVATPITVDVIASPTITASKTTFCVTETITLTATGCNSPDVVQWNLGGENTGTTLVRSFTANTYEITAICKRGSLSSPVSSTLSLNCIANPSSPSGISSNPYPAVVNTGTPSATLTSGGSNTCSSPSTFKWEDNSTSNPRTVSPVVTTTYSATCNYSGCVSAPTSITVHYIAVPTISASKTSICEGQSTVLTASGCNSPNYVYWSTGATGTSITVSPTNSAYANYNARCHQSTLVYTAYSATLSITVNFIPSTPSIDKNPATNIEPGMNVTLSVPSYICSGTVTWGNGLGTGASIVVSPNITTTYTATCTSASGCVSQAGSTTVKVDRIKVTTATPNTSCSGRTMPVYFTAAGSFDNTNFSIKLHKSVSIGYTCSGTSSETDIAIASSATSPVSLTLPANLERSGMTQCGVYYGSPMFTGIAYTIVVSNGSETISYPIKIENVCNPILGVSVSSATSLCPGSTASASFVADGINAGNQYTVELSDIGGSTFPTTLIIIGTASGNTISSIPITIPLGTTSGQYNIKIKSSNPVSEAIIANYGYGNTFTIGSAPGMPTLAKSPSTDISPGTQVTLSATGCTSPNIVTWSHSLGTGLSKTVNPTVTTTYTATCTSGVCISNQASISVTVVGGSGPPNAPVSGGNQTICGGQAIPALTVTVGTGETADWYNNSGDLVASGTTSYSYTNYPTVGYDAIYKYYVAARNAAGTQSATRTEVTLTIKVPAVLSVFTPTCAPDFQTYLVAYEVGTGQSNFTVTSTAGTFGQVNASQYGFYNIPLNTNVTLTSNVNGCITTRNVTAPNCNTITVKTPTPVSACTTSGTQIPVSFSSTGSYNGNFTVELVRTVTQCNQPQDYIVTSVTTTTGTAVLTLPIALAPTSSASCNISTYKIRVKGTSQNNIPITSNNYAITLLNPISVSAITAEPATIKTVGGATTLTASCEGGNMTWYKNENTTKTQIGTGPYISVYDITRTGIYSVDCADQAGGCISTASIRIIVEAIIAGADNTSNGSYFEGKGSFDYSCISGVPGSRQNVSPTGVDANTFQFSNIYSQTTSNCSQTWSGSFIVRRGNVWEIVYGQSVSNGSYVPPTVTYTRKYHTKLAYDTNYPPCTAVWIRDSDSVELTLTNSGVCTNVAPPQPCPSSLNLSSTNNPTDDINNGTVIKQASQTNGLITASNKITGTAKVTFQAKSIELNNGFKADSGTVFKAEIGGCQ